MDADDATRTAVQEIPSIPVGEDNRPVFSEPWQAEVFAMVLRLHTKSVFTWPEWVEYFSAELANVTHEADASATEQSYYQCWLRALERIVVAKSLGSEQQLDTLYQRWNHAADTTPHGQPIVLTQADLRDAGL